MTDDIAASHGLDLTGFTSVVLTTAAEGDPDDAESSAAEAPRPKAHDRRA